jgi:hypothetical protein
MSLVAKLLAIPAVLAFFACFLYVLFGQITVRKLRKNPETKDQLGFELASGWDILNVAAALSRPKWITNKYKKSRLSSFAASSDTLYQNTTLFDRILARVFWFSYVISGSCLILILVLNWCGVFD